MSTLTFIETQMVRYGMSLYFALGIFGNICNCVIFAQPNYRRAVSSIYFIFFSIFAIIYLIWSIVPYFYTLYYTEPAIYILFYCKIKLYVTHVLGQYLRFCVVFVCIDRFLATRADARVRLLNSTALAKKLLLIMIIGCPLIAIHLPILIQIQNNVCSQFGIYKLIYAIYQLFIIGIVPHVLMSVFSILAIISLRQRHNSQQRAKRRDRYLARMVVVEVVLNVLTSVPYSINLIYGAVTYSTSKTSERIRIESFITFVTTFQIYLVSVIPFYLFLLTAKPFRKEFFNVIGKYGCKCIFRHVQVTPSIDHYMTASINQHRDVSGVL